ncbi:MAG TPA: HAD family hydrolase [Candidatus Angelobacter sp.]|jgi:HAD superfamily hydrolase (TIGR01509 family)|nr:HAD family hydrolase [Candidatus Angelobacter sp.]
MQLHDFDVVVFDLDGVLIDSRPQMEFVFRECYREFGNGAEPPLQEFFHRMGMPLPDILRDLGLPPEMAPKYREMSRQLYKQIRVVRGATSTLKLLHGLGVPLGLMTGKDRARTLEILNYFGLSQFFSEIVCGDDSHPGKPAPDGLWYLASAFDVSPDRLVLVGDSVLDVSCGLAAGAITVAATWGFESPQRMFDSGAHVYCSSFSHLESWFFACRRYFHADTDLVYQEMEAD